MKNGLTKFVLLIDYCGEYTLKLDNIETQKHIYENIDDYQMVSQMECTILLDDLQESHNNKVTYLEERILNLENKLSVQDDYIKELEERSLLSFSQWNKTQPKISISKIKGGE